jgi:ubiquinone/menaquinone biosynthesis C-methylase UbiE
MATYTTSAPFYDHIYRLKDYQAEVRKLLRFIEGFMPVQGAGKTLLDVACGTGAHLVFLARYFDCIGVDLSEGLLEVARDKLPSIPFHQGDMRNFDLGQTFDVVTCLFSAIGYVQTVDGLRQSITAMARHVAPGGVLIVEPWFHPDGFIDGYVFSELIETPELRLARMSVSKIRDGRSLIDVHHLVATAAGVTHFTELHEMGLFTQEDYMQAFTDAHLQTTHDEKGLTGRGLYFGVRSVS